MKEYRIDDYLVEIARRKYFRNIYDVSIIKDKVLFSTELHNNQTREEMMENIHEYKSIDHGLIPSDKLKEIICEVIDKLEEIKVNKR